MSFFKSAQSLLNHGGLLCGLLSEIRKRLIFDFSAIPVKNLVRALTLVFGSLKSDSWIKERSPWLVGEFRLV